jgi:hypothetical protein
MDFVIFFQLSERLGLIHISQGEGEDRHIVIRKKGTDNITEGTESDITKCSRSVLLRNETSSSTLKNGERTFMEDQEMCGKSEPQDEAKGKKKKKKNLKDKSFRTVSDKEGPNGVKEKSVNDSEVLKPIAPPGSVVCEKCGKTIPSQNYELHFLRCGTFQNRQVKSQNGTSTDPHTKSGSSKSGALQTDTKFKRGPNGPKTKGVKSLENVDGDDFDALLAAATKLDTVCNFLKCKTSTTCVGQKCEFCGLRFCLLHHIPEVHGCGDKAKLAARQTLIREGVLYRGSGVPSKKPDAQKRAHLQSKLDKALLEKAGQRHRKKNVEQN